MNHAYLKRFGDDRYQHFSYGDPIQEQHYFKKRGAGTHLSTLKDKWQNGEAKPIERLCFWVFHMVETIHRIDFNSKYYFHTFTPKARNLPSIKIGIIFEGQLYYFHPLTNEVHVRPNTSIQLPSSKAHVLLFSDDSTTQYYYGEFHKMLSALNAGHALFNVEYALWKSDTPYRYQEYVALAKNEEHQFNATHLSIVAAIEVDLMDASPSMSSKSLNESLFIIKKMNQMPLQNLSKVFMGINEQHFQSRSAVQSQGGDLVFNKQLPKQAFEQLIRQLQQILPETCIGLKLFINDVECMKKGYYALTKNAIELIKETQSETEHNRILKEYIQFTNLQGFNIWVFHILENPEQLTNLNESFHVMGMIGQLVSVSVAGEGFAARCMKNYDDDYLKAQMGLSQKALITYSTVIFPNRNFSQAIHITD